MHQAVSADRPVARRRACLSVPGSSRSMIDKACAAGADEVVIDLEDAVAVDVKDAARATVVAALGEIPLDVNVAVRVNAPGTPWCHQDLVAVASAARPPDSVIVPKVESTGDVAFADRLLAGVAAGRTADAGAGAGAGADAARTPVLQALIESPAGLTAVDAIAGASPRLASLILGYADLGAALGRRAGAGREIWNPAREAVLLAARRHGLQAIDGPSLTVHVDDAFTTDTDLAAQQGWDGRWAIHPRQVPALVAAFSASDDELRWARAVLAALEGAAARGAGAVALDGQMLDEAVRVAAERTLARAAGNGV